MASQLLDYNQVVEQSANTGDVVPSTGGIMSWDFRCDPNYSWDPSQSYFVVEVLASPADLADVPTKDLSTGSTTEFDIFTKQKAYLRDMVDHWPLRCFSSMTHIVDGVTIANSNQPYIDRFMQKRYLSENTVSNSSNFSAQLDTSSNYANPMVVDAWGLQSTPILPMPNIEPAYEVRSLSVAQTAFASGSQIYTVIFQPPFDFWTKHQRCSGGNHQIQLNVRPQADATKKWGKYTVPWISGTTVRGGGGTPITVGSNKFYKDQTLYGDTDYPTVELRQIRLMRRMVRFNVQRPLSVQEYNLTEMALFQSSPITLTDTVKNRNANSLGSISKLTTNFLLPTSTFGIAIFFSMVGDEQKTPFGPQGPLGTGDGLEKANSVDKHVSVEVQDLFFTYGGETYPANRIKKIGGVTGYGASPNGAPGIFKMQLLSHQLQGVMNMPQDYVHGLFHAQTSWKSLDDKMLYFPVAKHNNTDTSDLHIEVSAALAYVSNRFNAAADSLVPIPSRKIQLNVMAFYDARVELAYNQGNQLERVTKTEWR